MSQIERVRSMQKLFDEVSPIVEKLSDAIENNNLNKKLIDEFLNIEKDLSTLNDYFNKDWMEDFDADLDGMFPPCLKRDILSQDLIDDLLTDSEIIKEQINLF